MDLSLQRRAAARRELAVRRARSSLAHFVAYVFGHQLGQHHRRWCEALQHSSRLVLLAPVEHGKTTLSSVALPLWTLGTNPDARIALVSETQTQAARPLAAIREHIVRNPRLREVFPNLRPADGARTRWSDAEIVVARESTSKDPSVIALGVNGPLLGARLDQAILDDVCGFENTFTRGQREKVIGWFRSTLVGRVVADGRIAVVGTSWHQEDLLHALQASGEYRVVREAALSPEGEPLWPEAWSVERLAQRRREIGEVEFSRQMLLEVISDAESRVRSEWLEVAFRAAAEQEMQVANAYDGPLRTFTGVDLGVGLTDRHDESVLFTLALHADGRRQVLEIEAGRWQAPELVDRILSCHRRFRSRLRVESNAAQAYIGQFVRAQGVPVAAHQTGRNRHDPVFGIESLAVELEQGRWLVPEHAETRAWARELLLFNPAGHPGDRVVASWLAREAAREFDTVSTADPFCGENDFPEDSPDDDGTWVLGPNKVEPVHRFKSSTFAARRSDVRHKPWLIR